MVAVVDLAEVVAAVLVLVGVGVAEVVRSSRSSTSSSCSARRCAVWQGVACIKNDLVRG